MTIRDRLWKTIFEDFFQDSMYFFFPDHAAEIDKQFKTAPTMTIELIVTQHYKRLARKAGRAEGRAEGIEQHVRRMLGKGFTDEQIADLLDVSISYVATIREKAMGESK